MTLVCELKGHTRYAHTAGVQMGHYFTSYEEIGCPVLNFSFLVAKCATVALLISRYTKDQAITCDNLDFITVLEILIFLLFFYSLHSWHFEMD